MATFTLVLLIALLPLFFVVGKLPMKQSKIARNMTFIKPLSFEEIEEAKQYASLFSVANDTDADVEELLHMGRKIKAYLGEEKVEELAETVELTAKACFDRHIESTIESHATKQVINYLNLVAAMFAPTFITTIIKREGKGDQDGTINLQ